MSKEKPTDNGVITPKDDDALLQWIVDAGIEIVTEPEPTEWLPTGSLYLDWIFGGGIPKGRFVNLVAHESFGKTTIALLAAKAAINRGERVAYIDAESALATEWAARFGLSVEDGKDMSNPRRSLVLIQPSSAEKALNALSKLAQLRDPDEPDKPAFSLVILDSLASLATEAEISGEIGDHVIAGSARAIAQFYRTNVERFKSSGTACIMINQYRVDFGRSFGFGPKNREPGGVRLRNLWDTNGSKLKATFHKLIHMSGRLQVPFASLQAGLLFDEIALG